MQVNPMVTPLPNIGLTRQSRRGTLSITSLEPSRPCGPPVRAMPRPRLSSSDTQRVCSAHSHREECPAHLLAKPPLGSVLPYRPRPIPKSLHAPGFALELIVQLLCLGPVAGIGRLPHSATARLNEIHPPN